MVSQEAVDLSKVALQFVDLLSCKHLEHQDVSAGGETDDWVEGGCMRGDTELNHLLRKCVTYMAIVNLNKNGRRERENTNINYNYVTSTNFD